MVHLGARHSAEAATCRRDRAEILPSLQPWARPLDTLLHAARRASWDTIGVNLANVRNHKVAVVREQHRLTRLHAVLCTDHRAVQSCHPELVPRHIDSLCQAAGEAALHFAKGDSPRFDAVLQAVERTRIGRCATFAEASYERRTAVKHV